MDWTAVSWVKPRPPWWRPLARWRWNRARRRLERALCRMTRIPGGEVHYFATSAATWTPTPGKQFIITDIIFHNSNTNGIVSINGVTVVNVRAQTAGDVDDQHFTSGIPVPVGGVVSGAGPTEQFVPFVISGYEF